MEKKNTGLWVLGVAALVTVCGCAMLAFLAFAGLFANQGFDLGAPAQQRIEQTFDVGDEPYLDITSTSGSVTVRSGGEGVVHVLAIKQASRRSVLDRISLEMTPRDGGLVLKGKVPDKVSNASIKLEITVPADTRLKLGVGAGSVDVSGLSGTVDVDAGAGEIEIRDVQGEILVHCGAGKINVGEAQGSVRLGVGAGDLRYEGRPEGDCRFETGAGNITLSLPYDLSAALDVSTGLGSVGVDYPVDGEVTGRQVEGTVGSGEQALVYARTAVGTVSVHRR